MSLTKYDREEMLFELISKLDALVKKNKIAAAGAFYLIVETVKEHPDYPKEEAAKPVTVEPQTVEPPPIEVVWPEAAPSPSPEPVVPLSDEDIPF